MLTSCNIIQYSFIKRNWQNAIGRQENDIGLMYYTEVYQLDLAQLVATLVGSTTLLYAGPG